MSATFVGMPAFPTAAREALADTQLRRNLAHATRTIRDKRAAVVAEVEDWEELRVAGAAVKEAALRDLATHLETLEASLVRAGATVHWARDAEEACAIVASVARDHGVDEVVKVKSMATGEIGLNEALEAEGIAAWETDLAELIVQLGDDLPSHILVPAIHRNRAEVREIFRRRMGDVGRPAPDDLTDEPSVLAGAAREHLREKFLRAKVAVSGANFAVADTGTLVVVESEGNGRMCLTLPDVLVSVVGIEKVVATWSDLDPMLRLLPRSSTGERMNPYTSTWSGVTPGDGPQEVHVVLLDNGRTRALADDVGRQALRCIRCSACLNVCPVYERVGGHAYGSVYPGPIGAILNPLLNGVADEQTASLPYASSLCGACFEVCPVRIDIPSVLVDQRAAVVDSHRGDRVPEARSGRDEGCRVDVLVREAARAGRARLRAGRSRPRPLLPYDAARRPYRRGPSARARRRLDRSPRPARPAGGVLPRVVGPHRRGPVMSARDDILGRVRSALSGVSPASTSLRPLAPPTAATSSRCSSSASRTTGRWSPGAPPTTSARWSPRCSARPPASYLPGSASTSPARSWTTGWPRPTSTASTPSSPAPGSGSPRPARSCSTTRPTRAAGRSASCPDLHVCIVDAAQVVADVPDAIALLDPARTHDVDQRTVGHERHRARPGRGRPRPSHAPRRPRRMSGLRMDSVDLAVLAAIADGRSASEVAEVFEVSEHVVNRRLIRIRRKLDAPTTIAAVVTAIRRGLL